MNPLSEIHPSVCGVCRCRLYGKDIPLTCTLCRLEWTPIHHDGNHDPYDITLNTIGEIESSSGRWWFLVGL